jgi:hypothetical protein
MIAQKRAMTNYERRKDVFDSSFVIDFCSKKSLSRPEEAAYWIDSKFLGAANG